MPTYNPYADPYSTGNEDWASPSSYYELPYESKADTSGDISYGMSSYDLGKTYSDPGTTLSNVNQPAGSQIPSMDFGGYPIFGEEPAAQTTSKAKSEWVPLQPRTPTGQTSTTEYQYTGPWPEAPTISPFTAPEWSEKEISQLTQKRAAPGLRRLRRTAEKAYTQYYENPNVKRMTIREALKGLGMGMGGVMEAAGREAAGEYEAKYGREFTAAATTYQAQVQKEMAEYQALISKYMASKKATTTTQYTYGGAAEEESNIFNPSWFQKSFGNLGGGA